MGVAESTTETHNHEMDVQEEDGGGDIKWAPGLCGPRGEFPFSVPRRIVRNIEDVICRTVFL